MNAVAPLRNVVALDDTIIANLVATGDLGGLSPKERVSYYNYRCQQAGLDPAAKPFDLLKLNGRLVLYANASCTQQLCGIHKLSIEIIGRDKQDDIYIVHARCKSPDGRFSDNMGAVPLTGMKGENLANAMLKATTKAIRRTVLAHIGLGMLDETEVETIPNAAKVEYTADPRGDISQVDTTIRDKHVSAIADILNSDAEELQIADMLRNYVADHLQGFNELYIATADELANQKICSKASLRQWLKVGVDRK